MRKLTLPTELRAEWIWGTANETKREIYMFLRGEFSLNQLPAQAELWITAGTFFHLFVNGRHLSYGPPSHPMKNSFYLCRYDITHLLETGPNVISVLAHHTGVARFAARRKPAGVYAQLQADGQPILWTDSSWQVREGFCYLGNRPRRTVSGGFAEKIDYSLFPAHWTASSVASSEWRHAISRGPSHNPNQELVPLDGCEFDTDWVPPLAIASRGIGQPAHAQAHVHFQHLVTKFGPGVYAAQTYLYSEAGEELPFSLYSDHPTKLLCNRLVVKEHASGSLPAGVDLDYAAEYNTRLGVTDGADGVIKLEPGWNQLILCQQVENDSPGMTLLFPELPAYKLQLFRAPDGGSRSGWGIGGPLRTPINNITGSLDFNGLVREGFNCDLAEPSDEAVHLLGYRFEVASSYSLTVPERLALMQGQFAVLDWGQEQYGVPSLHIEGTQGDIIDILFGEKLVNELVMPCHEGRQNADCIILGDSPCDWMACAPRGMRYLMVVVRSSRGPVKISSACCGCRRFVTDDRALFECSDPILSQVWETGCRTLDVTLQDSFLDSPCKETAQYIPDAMIQSLAACVIHGDDRFGAKALLEFADAQFETGEMSAVCPSDHFVNIPDYSLLWPIWLHRHHMFAGDTALVTRLMPNVQRLMNYFAHLADPKNGLLSDLDSRYSAPCFLDHGKIDRRGIITGLNALYCRSLWSASWLAGEAGQTELAEAWKRRASMVTVTLRELVYDAKAKRFADCWADGKCSDAACWQTNILALFGGLAPQEDVRTVFHHFFTSKAPFESFPPASSDNPYFRFFLLDVAIAMGERKWVFDYIRWYWGGMLKQNASTWWEFFTPRLENPGAAGTFCHGYGVTPNALLVTELAGLRPARPGFRTVYFNPMLDCVDSVRTQLSIPGGRIDLEWVKHAGGELEVHLTSTCAIEVIPVLDAHTAASATFSVNDAVTVLAVTP